MANNILFDQYKNNQLTEQQDEALEAALLKATFQYQDEQRMLKTFAQWRDEEAQKKGKLRRLYIYGMAASFLLLVTTVGFYKFYTTKQEVTNTAATTLEKPIEPIPTQKDTPTSSSIIKNIPTPQKQVVVSPTLTPKNQKPKQPQDNTPPQYAATNSAIDATLLAETETILTEYPIDNDSNTKMAIENVDSLKQRANDFFKNKKYQKYISTIGELDKNKITATDYLLLGEAYLLLKDNKAAIDNFKEAEILDPDNDTDIRTLHLAVAYIRDNQLEKARKTLQSILDSKTSNFKTEAIKLQIGLK